jgi:hypothetical protein
VRIIRAAFWFSAAVILLAALLLVGHLSSNSLEFSRYNNGWNGTSQFFSDLDRHRTIEISDPNQLSVYKNNAELLIIAPYRKPTDTETQAYSAFIERGNTLVLVDDFGTGNDILEQMGSRIIIQPGNLSSLDREYADPYSIVVFRSLNDPLVGNATQLVLNRAAPLSGGEPLMKTSVLSWIDSNGDGRINSLEALGSFPVLVFETRGKGRLVVLSDPSIFINAMQSLDEKWDNRNFIKSLSGNDGIVLIDQMNSRTRNAEGISEIIHVIRTLVPIELVLFGLLMVAGAWIWRKKLV